MACLNVLMQEECRNGCCQLDIPLHGTSSRNTNLLFCQVNSLVKTLTNGRPKGLGPLDWIILIKEVFNSGIKTVFD